MKRTKIVQVPTVKNPIKKSPGFAKKKLSTYKLDLLGLCEFGCRYCSSNMGNYLRIRQRPFLEQTERQTGLRVLPSEDPHLVFEWPDVLEELGRQLAKKRRHWGNGETLMYSMLTDGFSPLLIKNGKAKSALNTVIDVTSFRIRVLTKNAAVGSNEWVEYFRQREDRFVVGLSIGTTNDQWSREVEIGTSPPTARLRALRRLQRAGVATYGMLCPVFPDVLEGGRLEELVDEINPDMVENIWAEPFNDRANWKLVRDGYEPDSDGYKWLTEVYEHGNVSAWSEYATELYVRLHSKARREGWAHKLRYLLYELDITETDSAAFAGLEGVLLQSKPGDDGLSKNPHVAYLERASGR